MSDRRISGLRSDRPERIIRFLLVGGLVFVVYYALLYFLHTGIGMRYPAAVAVSYSSAVAVHFFANRSFTFTVRRGRWAQQIWRYALTALVNYFAQILIIHALFEMIGFGFYWSATMAVATTTLTGFVLLENWVFTPTERNDCGR